MQESAASAVDIHPPTPDKKVEPPADEENTMFMHAGDIDGGVAVVIRRRSSNQIPALNTPTYQAGPNPVAEAATWDGE